MQSLPFVLQGFLSILDYMLLLSVVLLDLFSDSLDLSNFQIEYSHGDELKSGCLERYECCQGLFPNSKGCDDRYSCCGNAINSSGCLKVNLAFVINSYR